ncbi:hypothetical protein VTK73DRAFT_8325 [Phialemonium thermophilum]|uniref:Rhodanese domain-containing protein n=1 Tax=Phialemonium thermophilum TaxID=223376 RepID=A0ABR3Y7U8_9PEZI
MTFLRPATSPIYLRMGSRQTSLRFLRTSFRAPLRYSSPVAAVALRRTRTATATIPEHLLVSRFSVLPTVATGTRTYSSEHGAAQSKIWNFEELQRLTRDPKPNVVIVDSREPSELKETGHIPGAINIPITTAPDSFHISADEFEDRFGYPRPSPDTEVVFYCKAGVRSRAAAGLARDAGWSRVGEYPGSWLDWVEKGGKIER